MTAIKDIIDLAAKLPSGLNDSNAAEKLLKERGELVEALDEDDEVGALLEAGDAVYYVCKHLQYISSLVNVSIDDMFEICRMKYELRARPGNPKDDYKEREAIKKFS